jgi:C-terminal processing protease CtpA/Prc
MKERISPTPFRSPGLWVAVAVLIVGAATAVTAKEPKAKDSATSKQKQETPAKGEGGYLGVYMQELNDDVRKGLDIGASTRGVLVSGVEEGSPAEKAGIEEGDIITKFDGHKVESPEELRSAVQALEPGEEATVEVLHDGKSASKSVLVGEREHAEGFNYYEMPEDGMRRYPMDMGRAFAFFGGPRLGVQAHEIDDDGLAAYFGVKSGEGVLVLDVEENSVGDKAGIKAGDVIREVGEEKIGDVEDLRTAVRDYDAGDEFTITVFRHGKNQSLKATMDEDNDQAFYLPPKMRWHGATPAPRVRAYDRQRVQQDIREKLDDLKQEMKELKEKLEREDG